VTPLQYIGLIFSTFILILLLEWMYKTPAKRGYGVPVAVYLGHVVTFYLTVLLAKEFNIFNSELYDFQVWSSILRLHGIFTILSGIVIFLFYKPGHQKWQWLDKLLAWLKLV
jgi:hypothetical protein